MGKARRKDRELSSLCPDDPKLYLEEGLLERKLPDIDLQVLLDLPPGLDYNEWLASHTIAFFDHINLIYGTISEFCTMSGCPEMTGPGLRTYLWFDEKGKKTRVAAPQYIDYVMTFTQKTISDESIFPTKYANDFPSSFESIVRKILRLLFHVLAHLYHCHFREVVLLNLHAHLNCVFAHLTLLNARFCLIDSKETEILHDLVVALKLQPESDVSNTEISSSSLNSGGTGNSGSTGSSSTVAPTGSGQPSLSTTEGCESSTTTATSTSSQSAGSSGLPSSSVQRRSSRCEDNYLQCEVPLLNEPLLGRQETVAGVSH